MFQLVARSKGDNNSHYVDVDSWRLNCAGADGKYFTFNRLSEVNTWQMDGQDIVGYHEHLRNGELLPITLFSHFQNWGRCEGTWHQYDVYGCHQWARIGSDDKFIPPPEWWVLSKDNLSSYVPSNIEYYAQKAAAKCYARGHDSLTFLAELTKTKAMFVDLVKDLLRGRVLKGKPVRSLSKRWLEGRYGWRTLKYDLEDLSAAVQALSEKSDRVYGHAYDSFKREAVYTTNQSWGHALHDIHFTDSVKVELKGFAVAAFEPANFSFNPVITGWELLTYSFVIDWMVNIGQWLAALSLMAFNPQAYTSWGYQITLEREFWSNSTTDDPVHWTVDSSIEGECYATLKRRQPIPIPKIPLSKLRFDTLKVVDLLALLVDLKRR